MQAVCIFLVLQIGSGCFFVSQEVEVDVVRIAGLLVLIPFLWLRRSPIEPIATLSRAFQKRDLGTFKKFLVGYALWALSSTLLHGAVGQFIIHLGGCVFLLIVVRVLSSDGGAAIARVLPSILGLALALSAGVGFLDPAQGLAGGRLRGVFINANLLGFYAFCALVTGILLVHRRGWALVLCTLSILVIVWTGSRASAIASLTVIVLLALLGNRLSRIMVSALLGIIVMALIGLIGAPASPLFRSLDTRDGSLNEALRGLALDPLLGLGVGGPSVEVASTPLRALAEGGFAAMLGVLIMYLVLLAEAFRRGVFLSAACIAAILHSFGEAWLLSSIGPMMLVFTATWIGVSARFVGFLNGIP